ncbi:hypothetical protein CIG19_16630 [Enterobacterales bacterium CwR94]|nr:hypothetical protein CIG19_16630 [Enterobacterales bacterium CwR94]
MMINGVGSAIEGLDKITGATHPLNPVSEGYEYIAEFLGFDKQLGLLAYQVVDLTTSYYGIFKLTLKPEAWRLFKYLPTDYYRKIQTMSKPALALKGAGAAVKSDEIVTNIHKIQSGSPKD